jgi:hypothetical protein
VVRDPDGVAARLLGVAGGLQQRCPRASPDREHYADVHPHLRFLSVIGERSVRARRQGPGSSSAGAGDELGSLVCGKLLEMDLPILVDAADPDP